ncbi:Methyl-CpG DNA binding [Macleaya cordata]|uniref:Methyl-CpG DNA binding n=1 Tax=Macleaya cordata TaxID=56857 RepID=A0A200Q653_MACCD|nr:Methyl-CpG DNA binding [Macleaya cordata]
MEFGSNKVFVESELFPGTLNVPFGIRAEPKSFTVTDLNNEETLSEANQQGEFQVTPLPPSPDYGSKFVENSDPVTPLSPGIGKSNLIPATRELDPAREADNPDEAGLQTPTLALVTIASLEESQLQTRRRRVVKGTSLKLGKIEAADRPEWLPPDWEMVRKARENGGTAGMIDTFYYEPVKGRQFRSKNEVLHFLRTGMRRRRKTKPKDNEANKEGEVQVEEAPEDGSKVVQKSLAKSQPRPQRRRGVVGTRLKLGKIEAPDQPEWLPPGWEMERKTRETGGTAGMIDTIYYDPIKGHKFRSKSEVLHYLKTGTPRRRKTKAKENDDLSNVMPLNNSGSSEQNGSTSKRKKRRTASNGNTNPPEKVTWVLNIDADGSGSLIPVIGDETAFGQARQDGDAAFASLMEVGASIPKVQSQETAVSQLSISEEFDFLMWSNGSEIREREEESCWYYGLRWENKN